MNNVIKALEAYKITSRIRQMCAKEIAERKIRDLKDSLLTRKELIKNLQFEMRDIDREIKQGQAEVDRKYLVYLSLIKEIKTEPQQKDNLEETLTKLEGECKL